MRIQPTSKSAAIASSSPVRSETTASLPAVAASTDRVDLSALSQGAGGMTPDRLEEIQAAVNSGSYEAPPAEISQAIVNFYLIPVT
jgi:hypothetical protein